MNKRCVLISSHLNTNEKINIALNTVNFLKEKNIPVIFTGNYYIPEEIQKNCDWSFYTKENPTINRGMNSWYTTPNVETFGRKLKVNYISHDYGYAHLLQIYRGFNLAKSLNYDYVIYLNYDIILTEENWNTIEKLTEDNRNLVHGRYSYTEHGETIIIDNEVEAHIFCFKTDDLIHVLGQNLEFYKNSNQQDQPEVFDWVCETFFKWMVDRSNVKYEIIHEGLNKSAIASTSYNIITLDDYKFEIYIYEKENCIVFISEDGISKDFIFNTSSGEVFSSEKTNVPRIFIIPLEKNSDYYYNEKIIFNSGRLNSFFVD